MVSRCPRRICCNPHIFTFCLIDGCIKTGLVEAFAESIGISLEEDQSGMEPCERQKRCVPGPFVPQLKSLLLHNSISHTAFKILLHLCRPALQQIISGHPTLMHHSV